MMTLHWSSRSPFVRKVMVVAHEAGQADRIRTERVVVSPLAANAAVMRANPLGKIPTLRLEDGTVLYDSYVICEYLDSRRSNGPTLFPPAGPARWTALRRHALGDGLLDNLVLWRGARDWPNRLAPLETALEAKTRAAVDALEAEAGAFANDPFSIGHVTLGVALAYLDFRFAALDWRAGHPRLAAWHEVDFGARPSVQATVFVDVT